MTLTWLLIGCISPADISARLDQDGDGFERDVDCDDANPNVHPGAEELCNNGIDDDCDQITRCRWSGTVAFAAHTISTDAIPSHLSTFAAGDFNGDGGEEVALGSWAGDIHIVSLAADQGRLEVASVPLGQPHAHLSLADVDSDGFADLILDVGADGGLQGRSGNAEARIRLAPDWTAESAGVAPTEWPRFSWLPGASPRLLATAEPSDQAFMLEGWTAPGANGEPERMVAHPLTHGRWRPYAACDLLTIGACDVFLVDPTSPDLLAARILRWTESHVENIETTGSALLAWTEPAPLLFPARQGDVNGDGVMDLVLARGSFVAGQPSAVHILTGPLGSSDVHIPSQPGFTRGPHATQLQSVALPDLDRDGKADIVVADGDGENTTLRISYGPGPTEALSFVEFDAVISVPSSGIASTGLLAADMDGDGDEELVVIVRGPQTQVFVLQGDSQ